MPGSYLQQPLASPELQAYCDQLGNGTSVLAEESENHYKIHHFTFTFPHGTIARTVPSTGQHKGVDVRRKRKHGGN